MVNQKTSTSVSASPEKWSNTLISSATSGLISRTLLHPIDTVKARLQVQQSSSSSSSTKTISTTKLRDLYKGPIDTTTKMIRNEGTISLYRGLGVALALSGPAQMLFLTSYEASKEMLSHIFPIDHSFSAQAFSHFSAGFAAEIVSSSFWVPIDVIKQRLQVLGMTHPNYVRDHSQLSVTRHVVSDIYRSDGVHGFYRGFWVTIGTFGPLAAINFLCYEQFKQLARRLSGVEKETILPFHINMICSASSAAIASFCTDPLDVVKTRFQVQDRSMTATAYRTQYRGTLDAFRQIIAKEGALALWKGAGARVIFHAPNVAIIMSFYEEFKKILNKLNP